MGAVAAAEHATDDGAEQEAQAKRGAHHAHALGAVFGCGDVGDDGLDGAEVGVAEARDQAGGHKHPQRAGKAEDEPADAGEGDGHQDDGSSTDAVGQASPQRRADELHQRVRGPDEGDDGGGGPEALGVKRLHGQDDAEAQQVEKQRQEDHAHGLFPSSGGDGVFDGGSG
jgi:hypothetical protein